VSIGGYYQSCECPVSSASLPFVTYAAIDRSEPESLMQYHPNFLSAHQSTAILSQRIA
jgi:hypothetical protein